MSSVFITLTDCSDAEAVLRCIKASGAQHRLQVPIKKSPPTFDIAPTITIVTLSVCYWMVISGWKRGIGEHFVFLRLPLCPMIGRCKRSSFPRVDEAGGCFLEARWRSFKDSIRVRVRASCACGELMLWVPTEECIEIDLTATMMSLQLLASLFNNSHYTNQHQLSDQRDHWHAVGIDKHTIQPNTNPIFAVLPPILNCV